MTELAFTKMHGLGNDFVVIDARAGKPGAGIAIGDAVAAAIADRHTGIGCDQLIVVEDAPGADADADAFMRIRNADGGEVDACGNATRCVGAVLLGESGADTVRIRTGADLLTVTRADGGLVTVDMGVPRLGWDDVPLAMAADTLHLDLERGPLADPAAASMGNPHATFFVEEMGSVPIALVGPELEHNPVFPERANIGVAQILAPDRMHLRVWERGVGLTSACGTGACAAVVNASRRELGNRRMVVVVDGGELLIDWREDRPLGAGRVFMTGPAETSFSGTIPEGLLGDLPS
jgi:diaminopimelate epimerase